MNGSGGSVWLIYIVHIMCSRGQFMVKIANEKKSRQEDENSSDFNLILLIGGWKHIEHILY